MLAWLGYKFSISLISYELKLNKASSIKFKTRSLYFSSSKDIKRAMRHNIFLIMIGIYSQKKTSGK